MQFAYQFPERVAAARAGQRRRARPRGQPVAARRDPARRRARPAAARRVLGPPGGRAASHGLLGRAGVSLPDGPGRGADRLGSLADRATREAFVHTARSVIDIGGQRVDARDRIYLAADLPLLVVWGAQGHDHPASSTGRRWPRPSRARFELFETSGHFPT